MSPTDPVTLIGVPLIVIAIALASIRCGRFGRIDRIECVVTRQDLSALRRGPLTHK